MKVYRFQCVVWVRGESADDALDHLLDEATYHFGQDNGLLNLQVFNNGELDQEYTEALAEAE
jgi:hypothetical protein